MGDVRFEMVPGSDAASPFELSHAHKLTGQRSRQGWFSELSPSTRMQPNKNHILQFRSSIADGLETAGSGLDADSHS